jgi:phosphoribosylamine--glycine ligase
MEKYGVRTASSKSFTNLSGALEYTEKHFAAASPIVIKADGLAGGKGVVIAVDLAEARKTLSAFMKEGVLGEAGKSVVIEDYLEGLEVSVLAAVSVSPGKKGVIKPFLPARDHKSRFEGGLGPNTGGMGAIAPVTDFIPVLQKDFAGAVLAPTLKGMEVEKMDYRGFIFFGLMIHNGQCYLLEYNARLGDPEAQAVLPLMDSDLAELCLAIHDGSLSGFPVKWKRGAVCAPVIAAEGYPGQVRRGDPIVVNPAGLAGSGVKLFVAGAERGAGGALGSGLRTTGGRVLTLSALGNDVDDARTKAYSALRFVSFEGMVFRKDIGREEKDLKNRE